MRAWSLKISLRKLPGISCQLYYSVMTRSVSNNGANNKLQYVGNGQTEAASTLSRINLKTQLLPRKRIKCSPSTLIVFKLFRCPHWNAASAPERWPDNLVPRALVNLVQVLSKIFVLSTVLLGNAVEFAEARLIRAPNTQCFDVYVELLHKDCIAQRLSPNKQSKVTTGTIT